MNDLLVAASLRIVEHEHEIDRHRSEIARLHAFILVGQELEDSHPGKPIDEHPREPPAPEDQPDDDQKAGNSTEAPAPSAGESAGIHSSETAIATLPLSEDHEGASADAEVPQPDPEPETQVLSNKEKVLRGYKRFPDLPAKLLAEKLDLPQGTVSGYASTLGIKLPTMAEYREGLRHGE